jgi:hypothetical protein
MKKAPSLDFKRAEVAWALLSFRMHLISFLQSIGRLFVAARGYATTARDMMWSQLKNWLVFQWECSLWRRTGSKSGKTSSES